MNVNKRAAAAAKTMSLAVILVGSIMLLTSGAVAAEKTRPPDALAGISVYFKLDPRLTQGLYMGDRWVSPPTYSRVGEGMTVTVDASARGIDGRGRSVEFRPEWRAENPAMVTVTPSQGNEVKITVLRPGQSNLLVTFQDISRKLAINATNRDKVIVVEIAQQ